VNQRSFTTCSERDVCSHQQQCFHMSVVLPIGQPTLSKRWMKPAVQGNLYITYYIHDATVLLYSVSKLANCFSVDSSNLLLHSEYVEQRLRRVFTDAVTSVDDWLTWVFGSQLEHNQQHKQHVIEKSSVKWCHTTINAHSLAKRFH